MYVISKYTDDFSVLRLIANGLAMCSVGFRSTLLLPNIRDTEPIRLFYINLPDYFIG